MKVIAHKLRQNIAIIFAAVVCALVIFFLVKNPGLFQASILSLEEKAFMNEKKRDAAYKTNKWPFEIFVAEKYETTLTDFQAAIYFNPDKVQLNTWSLTGQGVFTIKQSTNDSLLVTIKLPSKIESNKEIIGITFSGSAQDIVLGESKGKIKKSRTSFAVGNLNDFVEHSK